MNLFKSKSKFQSLLRNVVGVGAIALVSSSAFADVHQIKINSWRRINPHDIQDLAAEVCGTISPVKGDERILLTVDPRQDPASYVALVSPKGNFCHVVSTWTGQLNAEVIGDTASRIEATRK